MENNNLKQIIGQRIRECRLKAGYTQAQFAELMDISINFLSEIETYHSSKHTSRRKTL